MAERSNTVQLTSEEMKIVESYARTLEPAAVQVSFPWGESAENIVPEEWRATRKTEGNFIDPATADITSIMAPSLDPYHIGTIPEKFVQIGREYFARSPERGVWVWFGDLPDEKQNALWDRIARPGIIGFGGSTNSRFVRLRPRHLILRPNDRNTHAFVLLRWTDSRRTGALLGWCWGHEGKRAEYQRRLSDDDPAFFMPVTELHPMSDFPPRLQDAQQSRILKI